MCLGGRGRGRGTIAVGNRRLHRRLQNPADGADGDGASHGMPHDVAALGPAVRVEFVLLGRARGLGVDAVVALGGLGLRGARFGGRRAGLFLGQKVPRGDG
ncbi:hypothetical protein ACRAWF_28960 [Streptomyces sp. L7]